MTSSEITLDEILDRLEKAERNNFKYAEHLMKINGEIRNLEITKRDELVKLTDLPEFSGLKEPQTYLSWERRMDRLFDHKDMDEHSRFAYAILKLVDYASDWFENFQTNV